MRGSMTDLVIQQGAEQNYNPVLYIKPVETDDMEGYGATLEKQFQQLAQKYPGIELKRNENKWEILIPDEYKNSHEAHFAQVTKKYLNYLVDGKLPDWEVPNMIAKYYITTEALELARKSK